MRFVPAKSAAQQAVLLHHRVRDLLVRQRTMLINALRGHLGEFGIIAPAGRHHVVDLVNLLQDADDAIVPALAREALRGLIVELHALEKRIEGVEAVIVREHKTNAVSRWRVFQASDLSPRRRSPPPSRIPRRSSQAASWPRG
jgi:transposase